MKTHHLYSATNRKL